jgi:hypothetical protein
MAYSTSNPPYVISQGLNGANKIWGYKSENPSQDVNDAGFFTDGYDRGMRVGDVVISTDTGSAITTMHAVNASSTSSVDLATMVSLPTDTD